MRFTYRTILSETKLLEMEKDDSMFNIGDIVVTDDELNVGMVYGFYLGDNPKVYRKSDSVGILCDYARDVKWRKIGHINYCVDIAWIEHLGIEDCWRAFSFEKSTIDIINEVNKFYKEKGESDDSKMKLKDTIDLMLSSNYRDRFVAEYRQTKIRYEKLKNFCNKIEVAQMMKQEEPKHDCPLELLKEQQKYMGLYLSVLEKRAIIEDIHLD